MIYYNISRINWNYVTMLYIALINKKNDEVFAKKSEPFEEVLMVFTIGNILNNIYLALFIYINYLPRYNSLFRFLNYLTFNML